MCFMRDSVALLGLVSSQLSCLLDDLQGTGYMQWDWNRRNPPPPPSYNHCSDRKFYLNLKCNAFCVHITVFLFGCLSLLKIWELLFFFVSKKITMLFLTVGRCWGDTQAIQAVFLLDWWLSHQDDRKSLNFPACELQSFNHGQAFYWMTP